MSSLEIAALRGLLDGRISLVTGAGQGNGRAIALGLAAAGAKIVVTDINPTNARATAAMIADAGGQAHDYALDVTDVDGCEQLAHSVENDVGQIDLLVNNAGIIIGENSESPAAADNLRKVMDVNVHGVFNITRALLPALKARKGGIVNIASVASFIGVPGSLGYSPSKGALKMLTQAWAVEFAPAGIRVNAIAPGVIETEMTVPMRADDSRIGKMMARTPMGRVGQPEELVGAVLFLSSSMAGYVTGVTLPVDGGFLAM